LEKSPSLLYHENNKSAIREPKKQLSITLKKSSVKALKKLAADRECLLNALVEEALESLFQKYAQEVNK